MDTGCRECAVWLVDCGAVVIVDAATAEAALDCKASTGKLKMPSQKANVAHDDENLSWQDFLKEF